jgi:glycosyltransferase involved in cell wall biosynthesis
LLIGDRLADEHPFDGPGCHEFSLRAVPALSGEYEVRFMVSSRGRVVFATEPVRVAFRTLDLADARTKDLATLLDRFDLRAKIIGRPTDRELVSRLIESQPERVPDFVDMLTECGKRVRGANPSRRSAEATASRPHRRLKVLFASWEVPSRFHGGGVYLMNLLARIGELHDVTLVHTYGIDEVGNSPGLLRHVKRLIPVARVHNSAKYRGQAILPKDLYDTYIPELRRVIELELASGAYDLADYEYTAMGPYVVPGVPSVLTVHETGYTALLNSAFGKPYSVVSTVKDLDRLVRDFHYFTSALPSLCNNLITLTEEDASAITTFSDARVYTNPGGVDVDESLARLPRERGAAPVLAYVGSFQHPPNLRAALFFAHEVMPELRLLYPDAEFRIYGTRIPPELDGKNGVRVLGFVDDLRGALRSATALVAPIFTGTGMRMKVLEGLGAGALVIGTDLAMRGLAAVDRRHFYRANTATEFVRAIERAVEHPEEAQAIAQAGQALVAAMHSWESVVRRREAIWHSVVGEAEGEVPISEAGQATAE